MSIKHEPVPLEAEEDPQQTGAVREAKATRTLYTPPEHFPLFQVCVLFFASLTGALPLTSLFPYVANMVVDLGAAPDVDRAGFVSGYVASAFMFGRLLSSFYWGHVADSIGRKPVIYISCLAIAVFSICFGLSVNLWMALLARFLLGFLNPLSSLTKTLISEICSKKHQPMGMAVAAGSWSVGLVVGPALGGSLARSAQLYPGTILDNPMTRQFPYLLPNAVTALFGIVSLVLIRLYLPETMAAKNIDVTTVHPSPEESGPPAPKETALGAFIRNAAELTADRKVRKVCIAYFSISLSAIIYDECLPLWALSSKEKGGLDMTSAMIGNVTSITGIPMLLFTFILFPILNKRFGDAACFRYAQLICNIFAVLTVGLAAAGALTGDAAIPVLVLLASGEKSFACVAFTANFLLINDSVNAERRGSVNGFVMTIGGIAKTLGPIVGATIYAWSINNGVRVPPCNFVFVFLCCFLIGVVTMLVQFEKISSLADEAKDPKDQDMNSSSDIENGRSGEVRGPYVKSALHEGYDECDLDTANTNSNNPEIYPSTSPPGGVFSEIRSRIYSVLRPMRWSKYVGIGKSDSIASLSAVNGESSVALSPMHGEEPPEAPQVECAEDDMECYFDEENVY